MAIYAVSRESCCWPPSGTGSFCAAQCACPLLPLSGDMCASIVKSMARQFWRERWQEGERSCAKIPELCHLARMKKPCFADERATRADHNSDFCTIEPRFAIRSTKFLLAAASDTNG